MICDKPGIQGKKRPKGPAKRLLIKGLLLGLPLCFALASGTEAAVPANPNAIDNAKKILNYIADLPNRSSKRIISGEQGRDGGGTMDALYNKTGYWVGMVGEEYGSPFTSTSAANTVFMDYWSKGGLVEASCHFNNPVNHLNPWNGGADVKVDVNRLLTAGTPENVYYRAALDNIAAGFAVLQNQGIVVLWRPFHEMNNVTIFWWCGCNLGAANYKRLWQDMFNYFTTTKKLNNLLWVYASNAGGGSYNQYYPGDQYVDLVGLDQYVGIWVTDSACSYCVDTSRTSYGDAVGYNQMIWLGKPFGISEFGPGMQPAANSYNYALMLANIKKYMPKATWFLPWHSSWSIESQLNGNTLLADPWVINRPDVAWNSTPLNVTTVQFASVSSGTMYARAVENADSVVVTVTRAGSTAGALGVSYSTTDGSEFAIANGKAVAGQDYVAASGSLTWVAGDATEKTIKVSIIDDHAKEAFEIFTINLANPTGGALLGGLSSVPVSIVDNDNFIQIAARDISDGVHTASPVLLSFAPSAIRYKLTQAGHVSIDLLKFNGQKICTPANGHEAAGMHQIFTKNLGVSDGAYFVVINQNGKRSVGKFAMIR